MIFVFKKWDKFCKKISSLGAVVEPANKVNNDQRFFVVLKHDVETNVKKAYKLAKIEEKNRINGSFYVQAYLLKKTRNIKLLKKMKLMGHEISYHYDVMDSNKGCLEKALCEFERNKSLFETNGFEINTICQHGNPLIERVGYASNRDFFRNKTIQQKYSNIADIMVNFKAQREVDYNYYSDAGRVFKLIFDPINNDLINSDDKNISFKNLNKLLLNINESSIISTHPHRWCSFATVYLLKLFVFKAAKFVTKKLYRLPFLKKIINKHYYIAKKF